eukprot:190225-Rhodomonas_salina.3
MQTTHVLSGTDVVGTVLLVVYYASAGTNAAYMCGYQVLELGGSRLGGCARGSFCTGTARSVQSDASTTVSAQTPKKREKKVSRQYYNASAYAVYSTDGSSYGTVEAVSYTHLRAHETEADL